MAPDTVSPEERSRIMRQVRSRDTKPELRVRHPVPAEPSAAEAIA